MNGSAFGEALLTHQHRGQQVERGNVVAISPKHRPEQTFRCRQSCQRSERVVDEAGGVRHPRSADAVDLAAVSRKSSKAETQVRSAKRRCLDAAMRALISRRQAGSCASRTAIAT